MQNYDEAKNLVVSLVKMAKNLSPSWLFVVTAFLGINGQSELFNSSTYELRTVWPDKNRQMSKKVAQI